MLKKCEYCGKEFNAVGTQAYCAGPHYSTCAVCGSTFEVNPRSVKKCCSAKCKALLRKQHIGEAERTCELCGKLFHSTSNTARYCNGPHFRPCPVCGKLVLVQKGKEHESAKCCSPECTNKLRRLTCLNRYGVEIASQNDKVRSKLHDAAMKAMPRKEQTCLERYGVVNAAMSEQVKAKIRNTVSSSDCQARIEQTCLDRYGYHHSSQYPKIHSKVRTSQCTSIFAADGTKVDSNYEKNVYDFLLCADTPFLYQSETIEYEYQGKQHSTIIDFKIGDMLFEVKGAYLMEGCYDYLGVPIEVKLDVYRKHHVIIITDHVVSYKFGKPNSNESNGLKYLDRCAEPLIGIDVALFSDDVEFPYRDDRPHCFYDVKVDGQKSAYEAFHDPKIRWNMMMNRIMYAGGFIDAHQILNALNITRTCKQPSWFSKKFAKSIIEKYCSSNTIVDSFAGWGTRSDACKDLGRTYIGVDLNPELVQWHHERGRVNILYGDATTFTYLDSCSVFICPPYSDPQTGRCFEDYNFNNFDAYAKGLSQCDWMKIVMKNIPNAFEYILVCKIVDSGWEQFIVDTKQNRSHFGVNNEYVLCISNRAAKQILEHESVNHHQATGE